MQIGQEVLMTEEVQVEQPYTYTSYLMHGKTNKCILRGLHRPSLFIPFLYYGSYVDIHYCIVYVSIPC